MSGADAVSDADMPPRVAPMATASDLRPRRGLFRKYIVALVVLVAAALCVNAGVEFWFSFRESKAALLALQQEKADAAAQRIGEFVTGVERQIGWTTLPLWGAAPIDQRRFDFVRLLRQVPAITDLTELDGDGKEQLKVSRLAMDVVGSGADYSHAPEFVEARANGSWFSPVSFRKESEPYMTLALADAGRNSGVTVASINLKLIWDVITALKIGEGGYAYVVDGRGKLIADPDISLVLRDTDFSKLPQVAAALAAASADGEPAQTQAVTAADDYYGRPVLSAHARIKPVGWRVFVEVPLKEAYAPLYALALRNVLWLALALSGAALAAFLLARRMISPIHALQAGAAQIGAGDLDRRIDIRTGDELEGLANQFNRMAADLETSYAELERRVEERTAELSEALDQQTATAEVLGVINSSPGELAPVFDAMLEKATKLCDAALGAMFRYDGARMTLAAMRGLPLADSSFFHSWVPGEGDVMYAIAHGAPLVHVLDIVDTDAYRSGIKSRVRMVEVTGARTAVWVPLRKDDVLLGVIIAYRREVRPFTDKQIALLQNFAAQAVIAMENARLITETREALDQQTATAEVLGVINASPGNLAPVFDAMLERAVRLCEADTGHLFRFENGALLRLASRGVAEDFDELFPPESPVPMDPNSVPARMIATRSVVHVHDTREDESFTVYRTRDEVAAVEAGILTVLFVPLIKEGEVVGHFTMHRMEVRPFTDKQIALVQNFAAQAVIAMENARLITETQEALDQQTATAEVLQVINANPGDLQPVFDVILEKAMALCDVAYGDLELYDGATFRAVATRGLTDAFAEQVRRGYPAGDNPATRPLVADERLSHIVNMAEADFSKVFTHAPAQDEGHHTLLCVPLRRENALLGMIACARREIRAFSDKEITLLESFAAQAVIAMENARLLDEIRQRQQELRVTFDNMGDGVVMFDGDLRLTAWNKNFQELLDLPDALLEERKTYAEYLHILAARGEFGPGDVEEELNRRLAHADEELRFERTRPDGRVLEVRRNAVAGGGFVLIYSDITERKRSEEEIRTARDVAEAALSDLKAAQGRLIQAEKMASLGQLTAGIAHEIKNPLNFVNNFASLSNELLSELREVAGPAIAALDADKRDELDETMAMLSGNLDKIAEHGKRADNIVKSMLEHSRGVSGERRAVDLNALVEESLNLAYHGARAQDQSFNITLEREFDQKLQPIELVPQDMTRVFLNLIGNGFYAASKRAQKSGNGFRPVLRVATHEAGDAVEVKVRDNGTGIPADIRDKLFQPFFTTKPTGEGTGLGLSISYDIVTQQHGGTIAIDSAEDEFTEFTIRLPRQTTGSGASA